MILYYKMIIKGFWYVLFPLYFLHPWVYFLYSHFLPVGYFRVYTKKSEEFQGRLLGHEFAAVSPGPQEIRYNTATSAAAVAGK